MCAHDVRADARVLCGMMCGVMCIGVRLMRGVMCGSLGHRPKQRRLASVLPFDIFFDTPGGFQPKHGMFEALRVNFISCNT